MADEDNPGWVPLLLFSLLRSPRRIRSPLSPSVHPQDSVCQFAIPEQLEQRFPLTPPLSLPSPRMVRNSRAIPQEVEDAFFAHVFTGFIIPHTSSRPKVVVNFNGGWISRPVKRLAATNGAPGPVLVHDNPRKIARDLAKLASIGTARVEDVSAGSRRNWQGWLARLNDVERRAAELTLEAERAHAVDALSGGVQPLQRALAPAAVPRPAPAPAPASIPAPRPASETPSVRLSTASASQTPAAETPEPEAGPSGMARPAHSVEPSDLYAAEDLPLTDLLSTRNESPARSMTSTRSSSAPRQFSATASSRRSSSRPLKSRPQYREVPESDEEEKEEEESSVDEEDEYDEINEEDDEEERVNHEEAEEDEMVKQVVVEDEVEDGRLTVGLKDAPRTSTELQEVLAAPIPTPLSLPFAFPLAETSEAPSANALHAAARDTPVGPRLETPRLTLSKKAQGKQRAVDPSPVLETPMLPPARNARLTSTSSTSTSSSSQVFGGGSKKRKASEQLSRSSSRERAFRAPSPAGQHEIKAEALQRAHRQDRAWSASTVNSTPDNERKRRDDEEIQVRRYLESRTTDLVPVGTVDLLVAAGARTKRWLGMIKSSLKFRNLALDAVGDRLELVTLESEWLREVLEDEGGELGRWDW